MINYFIIAAIALILIIFLAIFISSYVKSPFIYPYKYITFDVSGKKNPDIIDYIDTHLITYKLTIIEDHIRVLAGWEKDCSILIAKSFFKRRRQAQFNKCLDEDHLFIFSLVRLKTRYQQINYIRHSFKVYDEYSWFKCGYVYLYDRYMQLKEIGFECVLSNYNSLTQRRLMTKELRTQIAIRDNYTCQICGKYMPDGVGLHIDHVIPVSKGGKSVPSNLQVLCSKCNGRKSFKTQEEGTYQNEE